MRNTQLHGYQQYFAKFKMAQLIVSVHELVQNYIDTADDRSLAIEISDEFLQLTRAVIKKHTCLEKKRSNITFPSQRECCLVPWFTGTKSSYGE